MNSAFPGTADALGPEKILYIRQPGVALEAYVVVDNTACGPALGGVRMASDVTVGEVLRLARAMTLKNAAAGIPHGGGKAGILADPAVPRLQKEKIIRAFAQAIRGLDEYIPGPDMGLDERCIAWIHDEIHRAAGLPKVLGGIPLDEIGATGFGLAIAAEVSARHLGIDLRGSRIAVQGFGAVGIHAARFLAQRGAKLVAVSDSRGAISNADGLPLDELIAFKKGGGALKEFRGGKVIAASDLVAVDCDIWIPAARPDVLTEQNIGSLKARLVLQGANIPATAAAEEWMHKKGILNVPDFIANAGGVMCAFIEYRGGTEAQAMAFIEERIRGNTIEVLDRCRKQNCTPRGAAVDMAQRRVEEAQQLRRFASV